VNVALFALKSVLVATCGEDEPDYIIRKINPNNDYNAS
jgi:hypothetical protein